VRVGRAQGECLAYAQFPHTHKHTYTHVHIQTYLHTLTYSHTQIHIQWEITDTQAWNGIDTWTCMCILTFAFMSHATYECNTDMKTQHRHENTNMKTQHRHENAQTCHMHAYVCTCAWMSHVTYECHTDIATHKHDTYTIIRIHVYAWVMWRMNATQT